MVFAAACLASRASHRLAAADEDDVARVLLCSGRDIWRNGVFAHAGLVWDPYGFEDGAPLRKLLLSGGADRHQAGDLGGRRVVGAEGVVQVLPGFQVKRGHIEAKIFFGPEYQIHGLWPDDPGNRLRGHAFGLRLAADFWGEPTGTTMVAGDASLSSVVTSYSARAAFGWRVLDRFYCGPETHVYGGDGYRQWRLGIPSPA